MKNINCSSIRTVRVHKEQFNAIVNKADTVIITCIEDGRCLSLNRGADIEENSNHVSNEHKNQEYVDNNQFPNISTIYVLSKTKNGKLCEPSVSKDIKTLIEKMYIEYCDILIKADKNGKGYAESDGTLVAHYGDCVHTWKIDAIITDN